MFTPQEIQEKTFVKAVFGGYDMQTVDEFLEPLTEDYITLYKENAVLKSKMKVLVEKLEEYRAQEQSMRKAMISAQRAADAVMAEAEKKAAQLMNEAQTTAQAKAVDTSAVTAQADEVVRQAHRTELHRSSGAGHPRSSGPAGEAEEGRSVHRGGTQARPCAAEALRL